MTSKYRIGQKVIFEPNKEDLPFVIKEQGEILKSNYIHYLKEWVYEIRSENGVIRKNVYESNIKGIIVCY